MPRSFQSKTTSERDCPSHGYSPSIAHSLSRYLRSGGENRISHALNQAYPVLATLSHRSRPMQRVFTRLLLTMPTRNAVRTGLCLHECARLQASRTWHVAAFKDAVPHCVDEI